MLTRAFLMCSDEKALEAVTQVLGELEIGFEQSADPSFAVKRLANQRFDPILVDCDQVQSATTVLNGVRNSSANQSSMTIAIVDGKAGVPTAFRLGAKLVLTKPVSLEQVRSTLRNALAMQRKEAHEAKASPGAAAQGNVAPSAPSQDANFGHMISDDVREAVSPNPPSRPPAHSLRAQPETAQVTGVSSPAPTSERAAASSPAAAKIASVPTVSSVPASPHRSAEAITSPALPKLSRTSASPRRSDDSPAIESEPRVNIRKNPAAPSFGTLDRPRQKTSSSLIVALVVLLLAAGLYAAWTTQPAFRGGVLSVYEDLHARIMGTETKPEAAAVATRPTPPVQPAAAATPVTSPTEPVNATVSTTTTASPSPSSSSSANAIADGFTSAQGAPSQGFQEDTMKSKPEAPILLPTSTSPPKANNDVGPVVVPQDVADAHVSYRVGPVYPYAARRKGVEGSVVLQASINKDGTVHSIRVMSGNPQLAPSAVEAVKQWRYEPYYHNGQAVSFETQVTVRFPFSPPKSH